MQTICDVYKSINIDGMYLYVEKAKRLSSVPEALIARFGSPQHVMTMLVKSEMAIAGITGEKLLAVIQEQGFYLQMPPQSDDEMKAMASKNSKLAAKR